MRYCMNCGAPAQDMAHYSGFRQHEFGKGRGVKCDDYFSAPQCRSCHISGPFAEGYIPAGFEGESRDVRRLVKSEEQLAQILRWHKLNQ